DAAPKVDPNAGSSQPKFELATVGPAPPHWTDAVPARVVFDETKTSRIGAPLGGRVSAAMVRPGPAVKTGASPVTAPTGDLADLYGARDKAQVDVAAKQASYDRVKSLVDAHALPQKELVSAEQDLAEAKVDLSSANQKLSSLKVGGGGETTFTLTAPRNG